MFYSGEEEKRRSEKRRNEKRKQENRGGEGKRAYVEVMKPDILMTTPHFIGTKKAGTTGSDACFIYKSQRLVFKLSAKELSVQSCNVGYRYFLRALHLACAGVGTCTKA